MSIILAIAAILAPATAQTPAQPAAQTPKIQTLIITGQNTVGHDWRRVTPLLREMLEATGRSEVRVTEDFRGAGPETLAGYDLVVLNYYEGKRKELWWGERAQGALLDFVKSGKGLVVYHFSLAAFEGWEDYERISAGNWRPNNGHHSPSHDFEITIRDSSHPITKGLRAKFRQQHDELYANLKWQPAGSYHLLATAWDRHELYGGKTKQPIPGEGLDQPMLWTTKWGEGKVFITALGHDIGSVQTPAFKTTFTRGAEWAATGEVTIPIPPALAEGGKREAVSARAVKPAAGSAPPSDAVVLFNGRDMEGWRTRKGDGPAQWRVENGEMVTVTKTGHIYTEQKFRDVQLHIEFKLPPMPERSGQLKGNSGVFLQGVNEVQILDGIGNPTYATGQPGAIYDEHAPLVNASRAAGEWQSYDIFYRAPRCTERGLPIEDARITVLLNGVVVQDGARLRFKRGTCEPGPVMLQDHSNFANAPVTEMRFKNIWARPLE